MEFKIKKKGEREIRTFQVPVEGWDITLDISHIGTIETTEMLQQSYVKMTIPNSMGGGWSQNYDEKKFLEISLETSLKHVHGWSGLTDHGNPIPFTPENLRDFIDQAGDYYIMQETVKSIRKMMLEQKEENEDLEKFERKVPKTVWTWIRYVITDRAAFDLGTENLGSTAPVS